MTSVLSGESQIGFAGPEASIYVYNEGKEDYTQVFAQLTKRDGSFLVSKAGLGYLIVYGGQVVKLDLVMTSVIILGIVAGIMYGGVLLLEKFIRK